MKWPFRRSPRKHGLADGNKSDKHFAKVASQILFNIALDYIMRQTTQHGILWTIFPQLENIDYADDIALLSPTENHLQKKAQLLT